MGFPPAFIFNKLFSPKVFKLEIHGYLTFSFDFEDYNLGVIFFSFKNRTLEFNIYKETHLIFVANLVK